MARRIIRSPQRQSLNHSEQDATDMHIALAIVACRCHRELNPAGVKTLNSLSALHSRAPPASYGASRRGKSGVKLSCVS